MQTDFERLQAVKAGELTGRGSGKTFAACHDVAGTIFSGDRSTVILEVVRHSDIEWIIPMLSNVLLEYGISLSHEAQDRLYAGGKRLRFIKAGEPLDGYDANFVSFVDYNEYGDA